MSSWSDIEYKELTPDPEIMSVSETDIKSISVKKTEIFVLVDQ